ncbi:UDPGT domain containing protein, partial [Asbolus verrucosus]
VFHLPARSHYTISSKLLNELANRGHNVTVVTPYPQKSPPKTLKEISVESLIDSMNVIIDMTRIIEHVEFITNAEKRYLFGLDKNIVFENLKFLTHMGYVLVEHALAHENIQKLLQTNEKYDVVILPHHLNEALLGIAHHFRAPLVLVDSMPQFPWGSFYLSHPAPSSYVPNLLAHFTGRMNFWQRLLNSFYDSYTLLYHQWIILPKHRELVKKYIPGQPDLYDFLNNASLLLINSHVSTYEAIPQVPNAIEVGGFFIQEPKSFRKIYKHF